MCVFLEGEFPAVLDLISLEGEAPSAPSMMIKLGPILRPAGPSNRARFLVLLGCLVGVRGGTLVIAPLAKQHASPESAWALTEGHVEHVVVGELVPV